MAHRPVRERCRRAGLTEAGLPTAVPEHLSEFGLGSISETADADPPHGAPGCAFQAWSVAEALRVRLR